jgi:GntR family transcriptional repressor for pyruvate dehydrogenase complex
MAFELIETKRKSAYVVEQILTAVREGRYKVGDQLPTEREIAEQTGVSRASVREALSALELVGMVERVSGKGTFIRKIEPGAEALTVLQDSDSPADAAEARRLLEAEVAAVAAIRRNPRGIERMRAILREMERAIASKDYDHYISLSGAFHLALAEAADNPVITRTIRMLLGVIDQELWHAVRKSYYLEDEDNLLRSFEEHKKLLEAVERGDGQKARELIIHHFNQIEDSFRRGSAEDAPDQPFA